MIAKTDLSEANAILDAQETAASLPMLRDLEERRDRGEKVIERLTMEARDLARELDFKETELVIAHSEIKNIKAQILAWERAKARENAEAIGEQKPRW